MWDYSDKVKEYFLHPKNVGEIKDPDAQAEVGNITCGDVLKLTLKIDKDTGIILDAKFKTFGCGSAIASSSVLTEMIIGKTIKEAEKITNKQIAEVLGGLPAEKMHCSVMGMEALREALAGYQGKKVEELDEHGARIICKCFQITDKYIKEVVNLNNLKTVEEVTNFTKAGGGCGECKGKIQEVLNEIYEKYPEQVKDKSEEQKKPLTHWQKMKMIESVIELEIRPSLMQDGGDIELVDIDKNKVVVKLSGMCSSCVKRYKTVTEFVEKVLKEKVSEDIMVELGD